MSVISYTDVRFINMAAEPLATSVRAQHGGGWCGPWPGVLFVQDVVMARSVEEEDARVTPFRENMVIDCPSFSSVHVLHQDGYVQGLG